MSAENFQGRINKQQEPNTSTAHVAIMQPDRPCRRGCHSRTLFIGLQPNKYGRKQLLYL